MSIEREQHNPSESKQNLRRHPKVIYGADLIEDPLPYTVEVDAEKAGDLFRFLSLSDEVIEGLTIQMTNRMYRTRGGYYHHSTRTISIRASIGWDMYRYSTHFEEANKDLNSMFLHEAYHAFDFHINTNDRDWVAEHRRIATRGCLIAVGSGIVISSAMAMMERMGASTGVACLDTPLIFLSGGATFLAVGAMRYAHKYHHDPVEVGAREFAAKYESSPEWSNIVRFKVK